MHSFSSVDYSPTFIANSFVTKLIKLIWRNLRSSFLAYSLVKLYIENWEGSVPQLTIAMRSMMTLPYDQKRVHYKHMC